MSERERAARENIRGAATNSTAREREKVRESCKLFRPPCIRYNAQY